MIVGRNGLRANVETMGNWEKRAPLTRREEDRVKRKGRHEHIGATLKMDQQINEIEKKGDRCSLRSHVNHSLQYLSIL